MWILVIIVLYTGNVGGNFFPGHSSSTTIEYSSKATCQAAVQATNQAKATASGSGTVHILAYCTEK